MVVQGMFGSKVCSLIAHYAYMTGDPKKNNFLTKGDDRVMLKKDLGDKRIFPVPISDSL